MNRKPRAKALVSDPAALAAAQRVSRWEEAWARWLPKFRWDWFVRLSWAVEQVSEERAERDVNRWLTRVRRCYPHLAAVVGFEVGPVGGHRHAHAVVYTGGERYGLSTLAGLWHLGHLRGRWSHGLTQVQCYRPWRHPGRGAAVYTVKGLTEVEVHGPMPPAYRPRR